MMYVMHGNPIPFLMTGMTYAFAAIILGLIIYAAYHGPNDGNQA